MRECVCERRSDRHRLAVVEDNVLRVERRQLVLSKFVQDDDVCRVDDKDRAARGDTRNVEQGPEHTR